MAWPAADAAARPGGVDHHLRPRHRGQRDDDGEQDYWEYPLHDLLPLLRRNREVVVQQRLLDGTYGICRFNTLQPPFNNPAIRRAVAMAVDQRDYMRAVAGNEPDGWEACEGVFTCGTPLANEAGSEILKTHGIDRARAALKEAGYEGEKVVLIAPRRLSADQRAVAGHRRSADAARDETRTGLDRLGHAGAAAGQQGAGGEGRLEHHSTPPPPASPGAAGLPPVPARERPECLVRLAERPGDRAAARRWLRRPTSPHRSRWPRR